MIRKIISPTAPVQSPDDLHKKEAHQPTQNLPLEVLMLLDIFARIEIRRQAKLRHERKEVN